MTQDEIIRMAGHRNVSPWVMKLVLEAVEAEREACAKVCEEYDGTLHQWTNKGKAFAAAIRARNTP